MKKLNENQKKILKKIGVVVLALLCLISLLSFIVILKRYSRSGQLAIEYRINGKPTRMHHPITINDIGPWMTFDYLNVVFKLEPNYLKNALGISDNRYPNININMYARHYNIPLQNLLQNIKQAITSYSSKN